MPKLMKINELAKQYKVHRNTIRNWVGYYSNEGKMVDFKSKTSLDKFKRWCEIRLLELGRKND